MVANKVTRRLYLILAILILAYIAYNYFIIRKKEGLTSKCKKCKKQCNKKCKKQCKKKK